MFAVRFWLFRFVGIVDRLGGDAVSAVGPAGEILQLAPLAAERPPGVFHGMAPAENADRRRHHSILYMHYVVIALDKE